MINKAENGKTKALRARSQKLFFPVHKLFVFIPSLFPSAVKYPTSAIALAIAILSFPPITSSTPNKSNMSRKKQPHRPSNVEKILSVLHFPFLVLFSLTLSSALYTFASGFTAGDLSSVSRSIDDWWQVAGLIGWKTAELAVGWWGEYDSEHSKGRWTRFLQQLIW